MQVNRAYVLKKVEVAPAPITIPKNTAIPPMTGIGVRCSLRPSGSSTMFLLFAILTMKGWIKAVIAKAKTNGKMIPKSHNLGVMYANMPSVEVFKFSKMFITLISFTKMFYYF